MATTTNVISTGYRHQACVRDAARTSLAIGMPIMTAKQTCIDGTAAYMFSSALPGPYSAVMPVNCWIESVKPHCGISRGGAVGYTA